MTILRFAIFVFMFPLLAGSEHPPIPNGDLDGLSYSSEHRHSMAVLGKTLAWEVTYADISSTQSWDVVSGEDPPLAVSEAVAVSEPQIARYFPDVSDWVLESITLETLGWGKYWYYVVNWKAKRHHDGDFLAIPVLMSGQPVYISLKE